jgi:hypothetical protein
LWLTFASGAASNDRRRRLGDRQLIASSGTGARSLLAEEQVQVPSLIDAEVANALRTRVRLGQVSPDDGWRLFNIYRWMAVTRHDIFAMFDRI